VGTGTPEECTNITSWPNIAFTSSGTRGTSVGTPLMKIVMHPEQQRGYILRRTFSQLIPSFQSSILVINWAHDHAYMFSLSFFQFKRGKNQEPLKPCKFRIYRELIKRERGRGDKNERHVCSKRQEIKERNKVEFLQ